MKQEIKLQVPATSANLGPGFDTLGVALSLYNTIHIKRSDRHKIILEGEGGRSAKILKNNMFLRIFDHFYSELNGKKDTFEFIFRNNIPISRGLGSSSAVIVAAIYGAYLISDQKITKRHLLNLALQYEKHPDNITPCILGGFCVASIHNDRVMSLKKSMPNHLRAVLIVPSKPMSTKLSRKVLPESYSKEDTFFNISQSSLLTAAIFSDNFQLLSKACMDKLHEYQRMQSFSQLFTTRKKLASLKPLMNTLSGSGSTMFAMFEDKKLQLLKPKIHRLFPKPTKVIITTFDNHGVKSVKI